MAPSLLPAHDPAEEERSPRPDAADRAGTRLPHAPDPVEQLGILDDAVFEAIAGRQGAMTRLRALWPEIKAAVGPDLVEESRDQYVRHALLVWRTCVAGQELRDPAQAIAAMDVVSLLFDE